MENPATHRSAEFDTFSLIKKFLTLFIPVIIVIFIAAFWYYNINKNINIDKVRHGESYALKNIQAIIQEKIKTATSDLMVIASNLRTHQESTKTSSELIQNELLAFSYYKSNYDQIRYIDKDGMEQVRIDYHSGAPILIEKDKLQNKMHRYYFSESIILEQGQIYISKFDLNIEHNEIELPYKPMLRLATPVVNHINNQNNGVIVINYYGNDIFQAIQNIIGNTPGDFMMLNSEGYWLKNSNSEDEWGFMFPDKQTLTFGNRYPVLWATIKNNEYGQLITNQGIITFNTIYPLVEGLKSSSDANELIQNEKQLNATQKKWKILTIVPKNKIAEQNKQILLKTIVIISILFFIIAVGSFMIAYQTIKRERADKEKTHVIIELKRALGQIKTLEGIIPICAYCKQIRDDEGYWSQVESYISDHTTAKFSHGVCPDCMKEHFPEIWEEQLSKIPKNKEQM